MVQKEIVEVGKSEKNEEQTVMGDVVIKIRVT